MNKIYLTIESSIEIEKFDSLIGFEKVDIGVLISDYIKTNNNLNYKKSDLIFEYLSNENTDKDIIIEFAIDYVSDYLELKERLADINLSVNRVFISESKTNNDYEEQYKHHSRWLDYSPEYIEDKKLEYNKEIVSLMKALKEDNIEIEFIIAN